MRRRLQLAAVAALSVAALAPPTTAHANSDLEIGVQDDGIFLKDLGIGRDAALSRAEQIGATHVRVMTFWSAMAGDQAASPTVPRPLRFDFTALDGLAAAATRHGLKLQLTLTGKSPAYATTNHRIGNMQPSSKLYARWVGAVASHFRGRGYRYSIWNEPNYKGWLRPLETAPQQYTAIAAAGYSAIKRADPGAQVLVGELASFSTKDRSIAPLDFIAGMLCRACKKVVADGFAYHPYDLTHSPATVPANPAQVTIGTLGRLTKALSRAAGGRRLAGPRGGGLDVYLTEWGYATSGPRAVSFDQQAAWSLQSFQLAAATPRVRQLLQYGLVATPGGSWDTGILAPDGSPRPAFRGLAQFASTHLRRILPSIDPPVVVEDPPAVELPPLPVAVPALPLVP